MNEETTVVAIQGEMNTGYTKEGKIVGGGGARSLVSETHTQKRNQIV